jgi:RNA recognition motif-containing protein
MSAKRFVGNPISTATKNGWQDHFAGVVVSVGIMQNRATRRCRGFAFIEMSSNEHMEKAIQMFNAKDFQGRSLTVKFSNAAMPKR